MLRVARTVHSMLTTLVFRIADCDLLRYVECLVECHGIKA